MSCPGLKLEPSKRPGGQGLAQQQHANKLCPIAGMRQQQHEPPEWIETDSLDGEISRLVSSGQPVVNGAAGAGRSRRCCKNSTSSGYSSHSPPLSAASYGQAGAATTAPAAGVTGAKVLLAPIREGEIIPRPVWPYSASDDSSGETSPDTASSDVGRDAGRRQASPYGSAGYRSSCEASSSEYGAAESGRSSTGALSAREVLLELSRTLSSVLEGDCDKSDEEILRDISRTVSTVSQAASGVGQQRRASSSIYEEIYRNNEPSSASTARESAVAANPINSRLYGHRCSCDKSFLCQSSRPASVHHSPAGRKSQFAPGIFVLPHENAKSFFRSIESGFISCSCKTGGTLANKPSAKKPGGPVRDPADKEARFDYPSIVEHEYTTLECSDECSSSTSGGGPGSWRSKDFRGFDKELDFTLDGLRAERLGRAIARAKRRRRWCRALLLVICLIFFVLTVVVVSLCATKGRKFFGSM